MKIRDLTTGKVLRFKENDKVFCIGHFMQDSVIVASLLDSGVQYENIKIVHSLDEATAQNEYKDAMWDYDYHIIAGSLTCQKDIYSYRDLTRAMIFGVDKENHRVFKCREVKYNCKDRPGLLMRILVGKE